MKRSVRMAATGVVTSLMSLPVYAATYYVAPTGSDTAAGTEAAPFATMARGQQAASAGDTVYFRGGTYRFVSSSAAEGIILTKSGSANNHIKYWAFPGEVPVFDFAGMTAMVRQTGLRVNGSYLHFKGIEIKNVPQNITTQNESWGIRAFGSNNIYEQLNIHHIQGAGFFLAEGGNNLILNSDSHHNYDPRSSAGDGENADGFGCHVKAGDTGNVFRGVRAWYNTDDGYDSINCLEPCTLEGSWAWLNGYVPDTMTAKGNGNGFKIGGFGADGVGSPPTPPRHMTRNNVAFLNRAAGFYANHHTGKSFFYNNTAFNNRSANFNLFGLLGNNIATARNNLAFMGTAVSNPSNDMEFNSWNLPVQVTAADFQSIDSMGVDGPRQADGSLPNIPFMKLVQTSDVIDKGTNVMIPHVGAAPDLGAYEYGAVTVPVGGAGGSAGASNGGTAAGGMAGSGTAGQATGGSSAGAAGSGGSSSGSGGVAAGGVGPGGAPAVGGSAPMGGSAPAGGSTPMGGSAPTGGVPAAGGFSAAGGSAAGSPGSPSSEEAGCSCRSVGGPPGQTPIAAWLGSIGLAALLLRKRRGARRS